MDQAYTIDDRQVLPDMRPEFAAFIADYNLARGKELAPTVDQLLLQPSMVQIFTELAIYEVMTSGEIIFRHCGSAIVERTGADLVGSNLMDSVAPEMKEIIYEDMLRMATKPCGNFSRYRNTFADGQQVMAETVLLPVISDTGADNYFVASYHLAAPASAMPRKTAGLQIGTEWLESHEIDVGAGNVTMTVFEERRS